MCSMQVVKPSTFLSNWKTMFPDFTTLSGSCQFIKKLMAVSVSAITYLRGIFPERAFGERNFCGIKLKLLSEESGIESVDKFIDFIRSCYDAIDKKYLYQVSIGICTDPENRNEVLESYNINFKYKDDEIEVSHNTSSAKIEEENPTVQATLMLLKSILYVSDILGPLPKGAYLTMKLQFNDEITPQDYELPGFQPSDIEKFSFPPNAVKLEIGKVTTEFNNYRMFLKTALSKEPLSQIFEESVLTGSQRSQNVEEANEENFMPSQPKSSLKSSDDFVASKYDKTKVECICGCKEDLDAKILQCLICRKKQHSICYGILNVHEVQTNFYCTQCIGEAPYNASQDDEVYALQGDEQKEFCSFRRALVFCASLKQVTLFQLEKGLKCDKQLAKDILLKLEMEGFVKKAGQKYIVNSKKISKEGYWAYFPRSENKENLERIEKMKLSSAQDFDVVDLENEITAKSKKKSNIMAGEEIFSDEECVDPIETGVENLNLRGSQKKQVIKISKRKRSKPALEDDTEEAFQKKPRKKRCLDKDEVIHMKE